MTEKESACNASKSLILLSLMKYQVESNFKE